MIHEKDVLAYFMSPGAHGGIIREKYWQQGKECPVVLCFGQDPMVFAAATMQIPWGMSEFDFAGYIKVSLLRPSSTTLRVYLYLPRPKLRYPVLRRLRIRRADWKAPLGNGRAITLPSRLNVRSSM